MSDVKNRTQQLIETLEGGSLSVTFVSVVTILRDNLAEIERLERNGTGGVWIPVEERMPEGDTLVLVKVAPSPIDQPSAWIGSGRYRLDEFDEIERWEIAGPLGWCVGPNVTAWMPLPTERPVASTGLGPSWEPENRLAYVFERLCEILPCDDDNRPIEAHARKVVAHVKALKERAPLLSDRSEPLPWVVRDASGWLFGPFPSNEAAVAWADSVKMDYCDFEDITPPGVPKTPLVAGKE